MFGFEVKSKVYALNQVTGEYIPDVGHKFKPRIFTISEVGESHIFLYQVKTSFNKVGVPYESKKSKWRDLCLVPYNPKEWLTSWDLFASESLCLNNFDDFSKRCHVYKWSKIFGVSVEDIESKMQFGSSFLE